MNDVPQHEPVWMDVVISRLLRGGVILSIAMVLIGLTFTFIHHPQYVTSKSELGSLVDAEATYPHKVGDVLTQVRQRRGQEIVMLGLLLLITTPVARVAFSVIAFTIEGDRLYALITVGVLVLLILSFAIGAGG
jgi:uncharacterized membrane protein